MPARKALSLQRKRKRKKQRPRGVGDGLDFPPGSLGRAGSAREVLNPEERRSPGREELRGCRPRCQRWPRAHSATRRAARRLCLPPGNWRAPVWVNTPLREARCKAAQGGRGNFENCRRWAGGNGVPAGKICRDLAAECSQPAAARNTMRAVALCSGPAGRGLQGRTPSPCPSPLTPDRFNSGRGWPQDHSVGVGGRGSARGGGASCSRKSICLGDAPLFLMRGAP